MNSNFNLGERISETKIVRKVLRSSFQRFSPKVTVIEKSKDLDLIKIEDIEWLFQINEPTVFHSKKNKSTTLNIVHEVDYDTTEDDTLKD